MRSVCSQYAEALCNEENQMAPHRNARKEKPKRDILRIESCTELYRNNLYYINQAEKNTPSTPRRQWNDEEVVDNSSLKRCDGSRYGGGAVIVIDKVFRLPFILLTNQPGPTLDLGCSFSSVNTKTSLSPSRFAQTEKWGEELCKKRNKRGSA
ncbi:hypothetical protein CDAR_541651 [Caerostris darwini]|uniref:Uncharacterized protein n=1 Tax=Caerostris darwini TaxID=1538125 RepID=A0AAV4UU02_9ARAC|nr:hypothetical protein CDAR_541651 [Caerostris darwini]